MMLYIEVSFTPYSEKFYTYVNLDHVSIMYRRGSLWGIELSNGRSYCISETSAMKALDYTGVAE